MPRLSNRTKTMLVHGAVRTGSYKEAVVFMMTQIYADEYSEAKKFAKFIDEEVGGASTENIDRLYEAFLDPYNEDNKYYIKALKEHIQKIKA